MFKISHSKAKVARKCQMAYYYKYIKNLRAKGKSRPLMLGSLVHECIESYIKNGTYFNVVEEFRRNTFIRMNVEDQALNADLVDLTKMLVRGWVNRWNRSKYTMLWVEKEFSIEIAPGILFNGKIDGRCIEDDTGREWLVEHKTCKRMPDESVRMYDIQTPLYTSILEEIGEKPVTGALWDYVRTKPPAIPERLQNGTLSQRKGVDTLPEIYLRELKRHGLNPAGYTDTINSLRDDAFYRRIPYQVSPHQSKRLREELIITAQYAQGLEEQDDFYRNLSRDCSWCDYRDLCYAEIRGDDVSYLMEHNFEVNDGKEGEEGRDIGEGQTGD